MELDTNKSPKKIHKNTAIELLRLVLTLAICMHHFRLYSQSLPYGGGYLATDCFFMISGYYILSWIQKHGKCEGLPLKQYIWGRIKRLYPQYLSSIILSFFIGIFILKRRFGGTILGYITELFMLPFVNNFSSDRIIPPDWYVAYLLLSSIIMFIPLWFSRNNRRLIVCECSFITAICFAVMIMRFDSLCLFPSEQVLFSSKSLLRAVFDINLGVLLNIFIAYVSERNDIFNRNGTMKIVFAVFLISDMYFLFWYTGWSRLDYVHIAMFSIILIISILIDRTLMGDYLDDLICKVSSFCYMIFLNHYVVACLFNKYDLGRRLDWKIVSLLYILCVFIYVVFLKLVCICISSTYKKITK